MPIFDWSINKSYPFLYTFFMCDFEEITKLLSDFKLQMFAEKVCVKKVNFETGCSA